MEFNRLVWLDSIALITFVNSFMGSLEDSLLSKLVAFPFDSCCFEALPLVKPIKLDFP
jgi:hypothetical protein